MPSPEVNIDEICKRFDLVTQEQLAALLGVELKTLRNRGDDDLPKYVSRGRRRLFLASSVREYLGLPPAEAA